MFKRAIAIIVLIFASIYLFSCAGDYVSAPQSSTTQPQFYNDLIKELENKIIQLQESYDLSESEAKKQIEELEKKIDELKNKSESTTASTTVPSTTPASIFTYKINEGRAIITGFIGDDESIVIPSIIDGFEVKGVSSNAFENSRIKSVIISNGVEYIDWFGFYNCPSLSSMTIPPSVTKIGYSAFDGASRSFTIYCHRDSFAESYAKSYGFAYAFI